MSEKWKDVVGYEGWYSVSSNGEIRRDRPGKRTYVGRIVTPTLDSYGYPQVHLYKNGSRKQFGVHRIVAASFLGSNSDGLEINHKDCNKQNNAESNLEYVTRSENVLHGHKNNCYPSVQGESGISNKLTNEEVKEIRRIFKDGNIFQRVLGEMFGVSQATVSRIVLRQSWKHI